ncbi:MAG: hypothetical protein JJ902_03990 [Roseibium sp.]|nr:hypothetical protein [Roseibium sp.]
MDEAQVEPGSLATSIIATAGTSATRAADVLTLTNLGVWYDSAGGAIYVEVQRNGSLGSNFPFVARLGDSNDDIDILFQSSTGLLYGSVRAGGAIQGSSGVVVNQTNLNKIAFAFQDDDLMAGVNGSLGDADLSATIPTGLTEATIGSAGGLNPTEGFIRRFMYFPSRVPNATLQAWTA